MAVAYLSSPEDQVRLRGYIIGEIRTKINPSDRRPWREMNADRFVSLKQSYHHEELIHDRHVEINSGR